MNGPNEGKTETSETDRVPTQDRGDVIGVGVLWLAKWSLCIVAIAAGIWVIGYIAAKLWVVLLPVLLAIVVATVLWPPTRWLIQHRLRPAAAASITVIGFLAVLSGVIALIVPSVVDQAPALADKSTEGINQVRDWLQGPPLNVRDEQLDSAVEALVSRLQSSAEQIATGVFSGVSAATSALITLFLVLVLSFFFVKDGPRFMPWLHSTVGSSSGRHLEEVLARVWVVLGGFIRTQALVSLIDAVLIGLGLVILDVPLALVLAVITFLGGFIPMVGAFVAGALAVLVALVANGVTTALIVLGIIIAVQQLEGNVLQPVLQSRSMKLHAVIVLLAVTGGGALYGITGAFLAVPVAAVVAVVIRYVGEQIDVVTTPPENTGSDLTPATD
ncbi:AI-2E family transporter [Nocardia cyriacigeorgica]|uniref:AI-2E family transporter n=1 Tax=Nocardia cyriacigeorgica TaxID=135487 RepID=A0A6P1DE42_9NOCA|nr:AI-2E family transporter [Nocardia cyriacigeorgica]NEW37890.1 AI-2E family transporter [Nocardia cyriacigeorgica]NEW46883.1 AI-2E family transporter [Nocardia cyriacigeorgica]NEW48726.1 AI-2E family transporter [Nocardia cyriacigeorgica]NEW56359.1 AI-2E family transporter [Nocardia cyriacigeorgica]